MIAGAAKQGILVSVITLIVCILGIVASFSTPIQMIPDLEVRTITVRTGWPGATPQDIEKEILIEQERYLRGLPYLQRMVSRADMSQASIELEFPFGVDVNDALIKVNNALSQVPSYPENVDQPRLLSSSFSSNAFLFFSLTPLPGNPLQLDMDLLRDYAEDYIRPRLESVAGVSDVYVRGGEARQIRIQVDAARLAQRGISLTDLRDKIRRRNRDASAGDIEVGKTRYLLRVTGRFDELQDIRDLELKREGDHAVRLDDVANVSLEHYESRSITYFNGERSLFFGVRRESGSNVIDIKQQIMPIVEELNAAELRNNGLQLLVAGDDVKYVQDSLKNVWINLSLGAILATAVMFIFLRSGRATLVGVLGIPICTIAAFLALNLMGRTINVISLAGVAFAIGMTVDNTIVVLESIIQAHGKGRSKLDAAIKGVLDVWPAVLASTATTVMVFAPVLFVKEEAGQLYSDIAIAISGAIVASMLVAVLLVPVSIAHLSKKKDMRSSADDERFNGWLRMTDFCIRSSQQARVWAIGLFIVIPLLSWWVMPDAEYLPEGEEPKAFTMMIPPPDTGFAEMRRIAKELVVFFEEQRKRPREDYVEGGMPPLAYYMLWASTDRIFFLSAPKDTALMSEMMSTVTEKFKAYEGMRAFSSRGSIISSNDGGSRAIAIDIAGTDITQLYAVAGELRSASEQAFDKVQINSDPRSLELNQPLIEVVPNWQRLSEVGMSEAAFRYAVAALSDGAYVDEFILGDDKIDIFIFSGAGNQQTLSKLAESPLITPAGEVLPLGVLASLIETKNSNSLRRVDGDRTVTVYVIPPRNLALETAVEQMRSDILPSLWQQGKIPQGVKVSVSGAADQLQKTRESLSVNFSIALAITYLLLVAIFKHWTYPFFILATVPLGMGCGLLGLELVNGTSTVLGGAFHQPFDMITMLGFLILLGTVVNNPILIVEETRKNLQELGMPILVAVRNAVATRLKPILMSTATTILGLAPLVLLPGEGAELYRGVGIIVLCGIMGSMILTLTFLPALLVTLLSKPENKEVSA